MKRALIVAAAILVLVPPALAQKPKRNKSRLAYVDPKKTDADFLLQGEYVGETDNGRKFGAQVIAHGDGKFRAVFFPGGLPGDGWDGERRSEVEAQLDGGKLEFNKDDNRATIQDGKLIAYHGDKQIAALPKVERKSPTLGAKPPAGAVVLFDGSSPDKFKGGRMTDDGLLMEGVTSKQNFNDFKLHLEFRLPYMPFARGQGRGNSGCYLQGRYEVQILDSFGLDGKNNECGGIYEIKDPDWNICFPPLTWQTYDIDYTAARYDGDGKKTANARLTVRHNGVVIHENVELPKATRAHPVKEGPEPGPIYIQNHGNPVRLRNIWVVEK